MPGKDNPINILVSVIVPCRNELKYIEKFIYSVLSQEFPADKFEVIIADGMSDDGTRDILNKLAGLNKQIKVIDNPELTTPYALNHAIRAASGDIILRMDVHTEYSNDYMQKCLDVLHETQANNVGGPARTNAIGYLQKAIQLAYHSPFAVGGARFHNINYEGYVDTVTYGCWKKETLEMIGLFDEELVRNQDDELNLRIVRNGGKIWQSPCIKSWYYPRSTITALFKQYMQYGYWKVKVIRKHKIPASLRHIIPGGFVGCLIIFSVLAPINVAVMWLLLGLMGLYFFASVLAALVTCCKPSLYKFLPVMPVVFAAYHIGYGYGFLRGVVDFIFLQKGGHHSFAAITRGQGK